MGRHYQKGSKPPAKGTHAAKRDRGKRPERQTGGDVPWPELGDGTPYTPAIARVVLKEDPTWAGRIQWTRWSNPDGSYMKEREDVKAATKTLPERRSLKEGAWFATVSWDNADDFASRPSATLRLDALVPEPVA